MDSDLVAKYIKINSLGIIRENENLKKHNTLKIGGIAKLYYYPNSINNLSKCIKFFQKQNIKYFIIGKGSNILISDKIHNKVFIDLKMLNTMSLENNQFHVACGTNSITFGKYLLNYNKEMALLFLLIPGTIGGLINMNASCYNRSISDYLVECTCINNEGNIKTYKQDFLFGYRTSIFKQQNLIIVNAVFDSTCMAKDEIEYKFKEYMNRKLSTQPLKCYSAGSTFINFKDVSAWKLIDSVGLRGYKIGDAMVSDIHTNFLINNGTATFGDMIKLIEEIKEKVMINYNRELKCEWIIVE